MILKDHPGWNLINNDNVWLHIDICKMILINNWLEIIQVDNWKNILVDIRLTIMPAIWLL